jgi:hypothetical protein
MTADELWLYAVDYAAGPGSIEERMIIRLLNHTNGDVGAAIALMTKTHWYDDREIKYDDDSIAVRLANGAIAGPGVPSVSKFGSAATNKIEAWYPESRLTNDPDIRISWREVFEFIKAGRKRTVQLSFISIGG